MTFEEKWLEHWNGDSKRQEQWRELLGDPILDGLKAWAQAGWNWKTSVARECAQRVRDSLWDSNDHVVLSRFCEALIAAVEDKTTPGEVDDSSS